MFVKGKIMRDEQELKQVLKQALKRQYLETKSRAGVYAIRNRITGRTLVAGAGNVDGMLNRHRFELRQGRHRNAGLARDWAAHGEAGFLFEVLDRVRECDDPAFDVAQELELLASLWRQEIAGDSYGEVAAN